MTTYELFRYGLINRIQQNTIGGDTPKDFLCKLLDDPAVIYSDKVAKSVIAHLEPQYIWTGDHEPLAGYAFGDRKHITPKYKQGDFCVTFHSGLPNTEVPAVCFNEPIMLVVCPPGYTLCKTFNQHYEPFLRGRGILGRNSLLYTVTP